MRREGAGLTSVSEIRRERVGDTKIEVKSPLCPSRAPETPDIPKGRAGGTQYFLCQGPELPFRLPTSREQEARGIVEEREGE